VSTHSGEEAHIAALGLASQNASKHSMSLAARAAGAPLLYACHRSESTTFPGSSTPCCAAAGSMNAKLVSSAAQINQLIIIVVISMHT
jgi:hypothetical protein